MMLLVVMSAALGWWLTPHLCRIFDQRVGQRRLRGVPITTVASPSLLPSPSQAFSDADLCESLAMTIRSGVSAHHALEKLSANNVLPSEFSMVVAEKSERPLQEILRQFRERAQQSRHSLLATLLLQSYRYGSLEPFALDIAAQTLRNNEQRNTRVLSATAQARITARLLTLLPPLALLMGVFISATVRSSIQRPVVLGLICTGFCLNGAGFMWMRGITQSVENTSQPTALQELLTSTTISSHAGDSLVASIESWAEVNATGKRVVERLHQGEPLSHALSPLEDNSGPLGQMVKRLLIENHQAGTPLLDVVGRLKQDVEAETSRRTEIQLQQMSTKLTVPIVFCLLPAFLLLVLIPVAIASIGTLPTSSVL